MRTPRAGHGLLIALLTLSLAACGEGTGADDEPAGERTGVAQPAPTTVPAATGEVRTRGTVTVLQADGDGDPVVCLGPVALSSPPQCDGEPLTDWRWSEHPEHARSGGARWGAFELRGTWDGTSLTVTDAVPGDEAEPREDEAPDLTTPCTEPPAGWVVDPRRTDGRALDATLTAAGRLADHAETWVDPETDVVNVRVTDDVAGAETQLRRTWGGGLCVAEAQYSEEELVDLAAALQELPGVRSSSAHADVVTLDVVHDDGTLQEWVDQTHGEGRVTIRSALVPA